MLITQYSQGMSNLSAQFLLRSDVIFLNHGSFGACPRPVFEDYQKWQLELERQPVEFLSRRFDRVYKPTENVSINDPMDRILKGVTTGG